MDKIAIYDPQQPISEEFKTELIDFLYTQMGKYGDTKQEMSLAIDYSMGISSKIGGIILILYKDSDIIAAAVILKTGMAKYIPENILIYLATHKEYRNMGLGKKLLDKIKEITEGSIAMHVEADNPALNLYGREGFVNKYLEMRFLR